jgi:hypothetical protein
MPSWYGGSAPVVQAALMGGLSLFARQVGRRQNGLNSLAFVGAILALSPGNNSKGTSRLSTCKATA